MSGILSLAKNITRQKIDSHDFEKKYSLQQRKKEVKTLSSKYPERVPVLIYPADKNQPSIEKTKYLVPKDLTMSQFHYIIKKYISVKPEQAIFLFTKNNSLVNSSKSIAEIYKEHKSEDEFLYFIYSIENTFG
jgi:hypothetical protein